MVINYKAGSSHTDADALSRRPPDHERDDQPPLEGAHSTTVEVPFMATGIVPNSPDDELGRLQREHTVLQTVISTLENTGRIPAPRGAWRYGALRRYRQLWHQLELRDGTLYRKCSLGPRQEPTMLKIVPEGLVAVVLRHLHEDPMGGHFGEERQLNE